jgi:hypothetical protein
MIVADKLGLGPKREIVDNKDGTYTLKVSPPAYAGFEPGYCSEIVLSEEQVLKYEAWTNSHILIQDAFPELTATQREIILTGIADRDFKKLARDDED